MIRSTARRLLAWTADQAGYELVPKAPQPAQRGRPVGDLRCFVEDLRARGFRPRNIFDVGANRGDWSRTVRAVFPEAHFVLVEPVAALKATLDSFVREAPGSQLIAAAAGPQVGEIEMDEVSTLEGQPTSGSTLLSVAHPGHQVRKVRVPLVTLDSLMDTLTPSVAPELVKIDTEGFELEVLKGSRRLLGATDIFLLEASLFPFWAQPLIHEVIRFMVEHDYVVYDFAGFNRRPLDGALGLTDVCFVRRSSPLRSKPGYE